MTLAEILSLELDLTRDRQNCEGCFGRALQILHRLEAELLERERDNRLSQAERSSLGGES